MKFSLENIISIRDFKKSDVEYILNLAEEMEPIAKSQKVCHEKDGKLLGVMFYEPSTRTRLSFETAMKRLGEMLLDLIKNKVQVFKKVKYYMILLK